MVIYVTLSTICAYVLCMDGCIKKQKPRHGSDESNSPLFILGEIMYTNQLLNLICSAWDQDALTPY